MVAPNRFGPKARKLIEQFAALPAPPGPDEPAPPFVELPASVRDHEALMAFDRATCERHRVFRRRCHPHEFPAMPADLRHESAIVTVTAVADGFRARFIDEGRAR
ncbi:MAG TPA: hypothetical protein VGE74_32850 [Gemmata sp.]